MISDIEDLIYPLDPCLVLIADSRSISSPKPIAIKLPTSPAYPVISNEISISSSRNAIATWTGEGSGANFDERLRERASRRGRRRRRISIGEGVLPPKDEGLVDTRAGILCFRGRLTFGDRDEEDKVL